MNLKQLLPFAVAGVALLIFLFPPASLGTLVVVGASMLIGLPSKILRWLRNRPLPFSSADLDSFRREQGFPDHLLINTSDRMFEAYSVAKKSYDIKLSEWRRVQQLQQQKQQQQQQQNCVVFGPHLFLTQLRMLDVHDGTARHFNLCIYRDKHATIGFRGTDQNAGWLHNFDADPRLVKDLTIDDFRCGNKDNNDDDEEEGYFDPTGADPTIASHVKEFLASLSHTFRSHPTVCVHYGFIDAVVRSLQHGDVWGTTTRWLQQQSSQPQQIVVQCVGHSLAGAMASIFAAALAGYIEQQNNLRNAGISVDLVTFGAPRVFTQSGADCLFQRQGNKNNNNNNNGNALRNVTRFVAFAHTALTRTKVPDPVTMVPPPTTMLPILNRTQDGPFKHIGGDDTEFLVHCPEAEAGVEKVTSDVLCRLQGLGELGGHVFVLHKMGSTYARYAEENEFQSLVLLVKRLLLSHE